MITELVPEFLFSCQCDLDNKQLFEDALWIEKQLIQRFGEQPIDPLYGSQTTQNYSKYNIFSFHTVSTNRLLNTLREKIKPALPQNDYVIQSWLNVFRKNQFIDWHTHWGKWIHAYHGYYCVNVGDSITSYKIPPNVEYDVLNKNGLLVFGKSADDQHKSSAWNEETPRITIAFDVLPIQVTNMSYSEHYIVF